MNSFSGDKIPILAFEGKTDHFPEGADSYVGGTLSDPAVDAIVAEYIGLTTKNVIWDGKLIHSGPYDGLDVDEARQRMLEDAKRKKIGGHLTSSKVH